MKPEFWKTTTYWNISAWPQHVRVEASEKALNRITLSPTTVDKRCSPKVTWLKLVYWFTWEKNNVKKKINEKPLLLSHSISTKTVFKATVQNISGYKHLLRIFQPRDCALQWTCSLFGSYRPDAIFLSDQSNTIIFMFNDFCIFSYLMHLFYSCFVHELFKITVMYVFV